MVQLDRDGAPKALAVAGDAVWVPNSGRQPGLPPTFVWRVNSASGAIGEKISVDYLPDVIAATPSGVWVGSWGDGSLTKIDPSTNTVVAESGWVTRSAASPPMMGWSGSRLSESCLSAGRLTEHPCARSWLGCSGGSGCTSTEERGWSGSVCVADGSAG